MVDVDAYIDRLKHLPPAPQVLPELLSLLSQSDVDSSRVVQLITYDPALTASVLRYSNSVAIGSATPAVTLDEALIRIGFDQVYRLVAAISLAPLLKTKHMGARGDRNQLWEHSVTTAVAAQIMARDLGDDRNLVFTAALLHDVGRNVLFEALGQTYAELTSEVESQQNSLLETERRVLGVTHPEVGGRLLERWKFPASVVAAVWFHHDPTAAGPHQRLAAYVCYANLIAYLVGYGYGHQPLALRDRERALEVLKLDGDALPGYMMETYGEFEAIRSLFKVGL